MPTREDQLSTDTSFTEFKNSLEQVLQDYCVVQLKKATVQGGGYDELWNSIIRLIKAGGKRLRPYLVAQAYSMYDGEEKLNILPVAAAHELLHLSMLVHDDIIDRDDIRYGILNVSGAYKQRYKHIEVPDSNHHASSAALLAGDVLLSSAYDIILNSRLDASSKVIAAQQIARSVFAVVGGELLDMESVLYELESADPLMIAEYKTAVYSFVGPLQSGALLAGAPEEDCVMLGNYGINLGMAFQLADDMLGVFGDAEITGKSVVSDIKEGKRTYLMQQAYRLATPEQLIVLDKYVGLQSITSEQAEIVRNILQESGALEATRQKIKELSGLAADALTGLRVTAGSIVPLQDLILTVTERDK